MRVSQSLKKPTNNPIGVYMKPFDIGYKRLIKKCGIHSSVPQSSQCSKCQFILYDCSDVKKVQRLDDGRASVSECSFYEKITQ